VDRQTSINNAPLTQRQWRAARRVQVVMLTSRRAQRGDGDSTTRRTGRYDANGRGGSKPFLSFSQVSSTLFHAFAEKSKPYVKRRKTKWPIFKTRKRRKRRLNQAFIMYWYITAQQFNPSFFRKLTFLVGVGTPKMFASGRFCLM